MGIETPSPEPAVSRLPDVAAPQENPTRLPERSKHTGRKRKSGYFIFVLLGGWSLVVILIIFGARMLWKDKPQSAAGVRKHTEISNQITEKEAALLNEATPICTQLIAGFLAAGTPEARNQFVLSPVTTAARMARFYELNPMISIDPSTLANTGASVVHLPGRRVIETQWQSGDRQLDAVFIEEKGEWRLDWDHFARYSDYPWALFLAGTGPAEGEFRLLARERLAKERKNAESISIVLYAPRFGYSGESGYQSPEFLIKRNTRDGKLLDAAFEQQRKGQLPFGVKLKRVNPEELIQVRVKVRRLEQAQGRHFELEKVQACHWYSTDETGVEITGTDEEK